MRGGYTSTARALAPRLLAATSTILYAAACRGGGAAWVCVAMVAGLGLAATVLGREWAVGPLGALALLAWRAGLHGGLSASVAAAATLAYVAGLVESWSPVGARELAGPAGLAGYAALYVWLLYAKLPVAVDLPSTTREAFSSPESRVLISTLGAVYAGLLAYYLYSPRPRIPRLLGPRGLSWWLSTRHRLAPFWAVLAYMLYSAPLYAALLGSLAAAIGAVVAYERFESPDAALLGALLLGGALTWLLSG